MSSTSAIWVVFLLLYVIFWVAVTFGAVYLALRLALRGTPFQEAPGSEGPQALDILKERYARGEVSREEFEQMRRDLE